ncbi:MAG TPA: homoserine dehydrogenase [Syntrophorhabdaceae bacterium]|nr:homoserine dehydrogenase [Syntrophorhabdaceae bacterium]
MIKVGIIGFGTVGRGTYRILQENSSIIKERTGLNIVVKKIAEINPDRIKDYDIKKEILTHDAYELIEDKDIDIVVELIGGITLAYDYIIHAIKNKKGVITANKALLAEKGGEIFSLAARYKVPIGFEASVCGGIPVIRAVKDGLVANRITDIMGILNGTSNYIMTRMAEEGKPFREVLKDAQRLGFAEQDPTYDIEGIDAAHKLCILISLSFGCKIKLHDISVKGISGIEPVDIEFAREFGYKIKLLAIARHDGEELEARVEPAMISVSHPLSSVGDVFNAVYIVGDRVGPTMFYGKGAGSEPTGSAVVSDIIDIGQRIISKAEPHTFKGITFTKKIKIKESEKGFVPFYLRFTAQDKPGVLSQVSGILAKYSISISTVIQKGRKENGYVPIVMLTHEAIEGDLKKAIKEIDKLPFIKGESICIRIEERLN